MNLRPPKEEPIHSPSSFEYKSHVYSGSLDKAILYMNTMLAKDGWELIGVECVVSSWVLILKRVRL